MILASRPIAPPPSLRARRRRLLRIAFAAAAALSLPAGGKDAPWTVAPYVRGIGPTFVEVAWETDAPHGTAVRYGRSLPLTGYREAPGSSHYHRVALEGLEPGTTYLIQVVRTEDDPSGPLGRVTPIRTAPEPGGPVLFAVVGDTQSRPDVWRRVAAQIRAERPDFLLHCGDMVDDGLSSEMWHREFFRPARELLATVPTFSVLGNHEADSAHYYRYFGTGDRGWRRTQVFGDLQLFLLDSERPLEPGSEQYVWLENALEASRARWRFVALHRPPVTSDRDDYGHALDGSTANGDPRSQPLIPLLEAHGVDILFAGHIHAYERSWPLRGGRIDRERGVIYVQTGGGGGDLEESAPVRSWHAAKLCRCHHYVTVAIEGDHLELRAYDEAGRLFDQMEIERKRAPDAPSASGDAASRR